MPLAASWGLWGLAILPRGLGVDDFLRTLPAPHYGTPSVGALNATESQTVGLGGTNNSVGYFGNGAVSINNSVATTIAFFVAGNTLSMALDVGNAKIWFRVGAAGGWNNDVIANQNPATNTGGVNIAVITGALFAGCDSLFTNDQTTGNFGGRRIAEPPRPGLGTSKMRVLAFLAFPM